jgi:hypothetical protein
MQEDSSSEYWKKPPTKKKNRKKVLICSKATKIAGHASLPFRGAGGNRMDHEGSC